MIDTNKEIHWTTKINLLQVLQCDRENREQLKYVGNVISDQSHATKLLAKPQGVFRYSTAWDFQILAPLVVDNFELPVICFSEIDK